MIKKIAVPVRNRRPRTACNRMSAPFKPADARSFHTVSLEQWWNLFPNYGRQCVCPDLQDFRTQKNAKSDKAVDKMLPKNLSTITKVDQNLPDVAPFFSKRWPNTSGNVGQMLINSTISRIKNWQIISHNFCLKVSTANVSNISNVMNDKITLTPYPQPRRTAQSGAR